MDTAKVQRRVIIRDTLCEIPITQLSRYVWVVVGEYHGQPIETDGSSQDVALERWLRKARERY